MKAIIGIVLIYSTIFWLEGCTKDVNLIADTNPQFEKDELYISRHCEVNGKCGAECVVGNVRVCKVPMSCKTEAGISEILESQFTTSELVDLSGEEVTNEVVLNHLRDLDIIY